MSDREILWEDAAEDRSLTVSRTPPPEAVALLQETVWGGRNLRYRLLDLPEKLGRLRDPRFAVLRGGGVVECVFVMDLCRKRVGGRPADAVHFVMAATAPERRREGLAERTALQLRGWCERTLGRPGLAYAYVEAGTRITLRITDQVGHAFEARLPLTVFSRARPRVDPRASLASADDLLDLRARLEALYADHELREPEGGLRADETWMMREGGRLVAAIAAEPMRWRVEELPGTAGRVLKTLTRAMPPRWRPLDLDDLHAVRFGAPIICRGGEPALLALMETALARAGARIGLLMMDARSPVLARIRGHGGLGALSRVLRGAALMRGDFIGLSAEDLAQVRAAPLMVSPADVF